MSRASMFAKVRERWCEPQAVSEARAQSKPRHMVVELLVFLLVFAIGSVVLGGGLIAIGTSFLAIFSPQFATVVQQGASSAAVSDLIANATLSPWSTIISLFATLGLIISVLLYCRLFERRPFATLGFRRRGALKNYGFGILVGAVLFAAALGLCALTGSVTFAGLSPNIAWGLVVFTFIGFLVQGLSEELLSRGYLLVSVARRYSLFTAVIVSSIAFAVLHAFNANITVMGTVNLFIFGIFTALYFVKTGNIWGVAAFHATWNFAEGSLFGSAVSGETGYQTILNFVPNGAGELINGGDFGLEGGLAVTLVLVIGIVVLLFIKNREKTAPVR